MPFAAKQSEILKYPAFQCNFVSPNPVTDGAEASLAGRIKDKGESEEYQEDKKLK